MTVEQAIEYCYKHEDQYVRDPGAGSVSEAQRRFDCLISCLETGAIKPEELADYGMDYKE